ncbi:hypothetical protein M7I_5357 [Glarea lozoyensis 74030]|uniref:Uncharacterized protein n=1 Tax=Glarea lozoyensis (strain ATCC 74030 / MF5533) TaxID=1104152 RepID=H0ERN6_GLAL7|nr:hypothetical protein M7I_5357 [Glarea lozoyensis 74030]
MIAMGSCEEKEEETTIKVEEQVTPAPTSPEPVAKALEKLTVQQKETATLHGISFLKKIIPALEYGASFEELKHFKSVAEEIKQSIEPPRVVVGVLGGTGSGKSSLINALLDEEILLPTNAMRAATTVLVDLPGVGDSNAGRVSLAEKYMSSLDHMWIVADTNRAVDDKVARDCMGSSVRGLLQRNDKYGSVSFILTKTDNVNHVEVIESLALSESVLKEEAFEVQKIMEDLSAASDELNEAKKERKRCKNVLDKLATTEKVKPSLQGTAGELSSIKRKRNETASPDPLYEPPSDDLNERLASLNSRREASKKKDLLEATIQRLQDNKSKLDEKMRAVSIVERNIYAETRIAEDFVEGFRDYIEALIEAENDQEKAKNKGKSSRAQAKANIEKEKGFEAAANHTGKGSLLKMQDTFELHVEDNAVTLYQECSQLLKKDFQNITEVSKTSFTNAVSFVRNQFKNNYINMLHFAKPQDTSSKQHQLRRKLQSLNATFENAEVQLRPQNPFAENRGEEDSEMSEGEQLDDDENNSDSDSDGESDAENNTPQDGDEGNSDAENENEDEDEDEDDKISEQEFKGEDDGLYQEDDVEDFDDALEDTDSDLDDAESDIDVDDNVAESGRKDLSNDFYDVDQSEDEDEDATACKLGVTRKVILSE